MEAYKFYMALNRLCTKGKTNEMVNILETEITLEIHSMGLIMVNGKVLGMKASLNISRIPKNDGKIAIWL